MGYISKKKRTEEQKWREEFSARLQSRMEYLGMNQAELTKRSKIPQNSISRYVRGVVVPKAHVIPKLARVLQVPVSFLIDFQCG